MVTNLHVAFGNIKRGDASVGETACKNAAKHALGIVRSVMGDRAKMPGDAWGRIVSVALGEEKGLVTAHRASHFPDGARCDIEA